MNGDLLPALAAVVLAPFLFSAVKYLQELRFDLLLLVRRGVLSGAAIAVAASIPTFFAGKELHRNLLVAVAIVISMWVIRAREVDADFTEGMLIGALAGLIGGTAGLITGKGSAAEVTAFAVAGALGGAAIFAATLRLRRARAAIALVTAIALWLALEPLEHAAGRATNPAAPIIAVVTVAAAAAVATVARFPALRRELRAEASLGLLSHSDADAVTHPLKRFRQSHWRDREARRAFVRVATEIAVRKRRQRRMDSATARLYQLEVLKLRMELQEIQQVEAAVRSASAGSELNASSDTMPPERFASEE